MIAFRGIETTIPSNFARHVTTPYFEFIECGPDGSGHGYSRDRLQIGVRSRFVCEFGRRNLKISSRKAICPLLLDYDADGAHSRGDRNHSKRHSSIYLSIAHHIPSELRSHFVNYIYLEFRFRVTILTVVEFGCDAGVYKTKGRPCGRVQGDPATIVHRRKRSAALWTETITGRAYFVPLLLATGEDLSLRALILSNSARAQEHGQASDLSSICSPGQ